MGLPVDNRICEHVLVDTMGYRLSVRSTNFKHVVRISYIMLDATFLPLGTRDFLHETTPTPTRDTTAQAIARINASLTGWISADMTAMTGSAEG